MSALSDGDYLLGEDFMVAETYLFTIVNWHNFINLELVPWPECVAYQARVAARPAVRKAMREEGLIEDTAT